MPDTTPIAHLRAVATAAQRGEPAPPDAAAWLVATVGKYEAGAATGLLLDRAMGLARVGGPGPWWLEDSRRRRDDALRELHRTCYPGQPPDEAARLIMRLAERRRATVNPPIGQHEVLIDAALRTGAKFPKARRLASILACNPVG